MKHKLQYDRIGDGVHVARCYLFDRWPGRNQLYKMWHDSWTLTWNTIERLQTQFVKHFYHQNYTKILQWQLLRNFTDNYKNRLTKYFYNPDWQSTFIKSVPPYDFLFKNWCGMTWHVYLKGTQHPSPYTEGPLFLHPLNSGLMEEFTMHILLISVSCLLIYVHHPIQYPTLHIHVYRVITHRCLQCSAHWCLFRLKKIL